MADLPANQSAKLSDYVSITVDAQKKFKIEVQNTYVLDGFILDHEFNYI